MKFILSLENFQAQRTHKPGSVFVNAILASAGRTVCKRGKGGKQGGQSGRTGCGPGRRGMSLISDVEHLFMCLLAI